MSTTSTLPSFSSYITEQKIRKVINGEGITLEIDEATGDVGNDEMNDCFPNEAVIKNMSYACEGEDSDEDDGALPFERMARKMDDITGDGGIRKLVLKAGSGRVVPEDSIVRDVLTGFDYAVASMRKGELSRYLISPEYALGKSGCPPRVPPNAFVMMEIELLSFVEEGGVEDFFHLSDEERAKLSFAEIKRVCQSLKEEGDVLVKDENWSRAISAYKKAMKILELIHLKNVDEQTEQQKMLLKIYLNMALCAIRLLSYPFVIMLCRKALEIDSHNVKAMFRKAQAYRYLSDFGRAKEWLIKARKEKPNNVHITKELEILANDVKKFTLLEKDMCKKMFVIDKPESGESADPMIASQKATSPESNTDNTDYSANVSPEFISMVETKLKEFQDTKSENELPFPAYNLTVPEIGYVMQAADELNLDVITKGEGYKLKLTIRKKEEPKE